MSDKVLLTVSKEEAQILLSLRSRKLATPESEPFNSEFRDSRNWEKGVYLGDLDDGFAGVSIDIPCADLRLEDDRIERHLRLNGCLVTNEHCYQYESHENKLSRIAWQKKQATLRKRARLRLQKENEEEARRIAERSIARPLPSPMPPLRISRNESKHDPDWMFKVPVFQGGRIILMDYRKLGERK